MQSKRLKQPDFGIIYLTPTSTIRIGWAQYLGLSKLPTNNSIPTVIAAYGFNMTKSLTKDTIIAIANKLMELFTKDELKKQLPALNKLFELRFDVPPRVINNYPFCKIDILTEDQLIYACKFAKVNVDIDYVIYKIAMKAIFTKENMKPAFERLYVTDAPDYQFSE